MLHITEIFALHRSGSLSIHFVLPPSPVKGNWKTLSTVEYGSYCLLSITIDTLLSALPVALNPGPCVLNSAIVVLALTLGSEVLHSI